MAKKIPMAICYDFDGTLSPKNMQEYGFIELIKEKPKDFWDKVIKHAKKNNMDQILSYMHLMLKEANHKDIELNKNKIIEYGQNIQFFKGVETYFDRINEYAKKRNIDLKHFIISSGLEEMIRGCSIAKNFTNIFASRFLYNKDNVAIGPAIALNYTTKTQFLFRINKNCLDISDNKAINEYKIPKDRPVPFTNIVYIGDGETDIPCMRIVKREQGHSIAVYNNNRKNAKKNLQHLLEEDRVNLIAPADYSENELIDTYIKAIINKICADNKISVIENQRRK